MPITPNLDAMSIDELRNFANTVSQYVANPVHAEWLATYARTIANAQHMRLHGHIATALMTRW